MGVLDEDRNELDRFITRGIDDAAKQSIGDLPRGRGVLGVLIHDPSPLRLSHVGDHPSSYGFPPGHPPMDSFLGVPVLVRGQAWGNLYLTDKVGGDFDAADEEAIVVLAGWAGIAIENARLYQAAERRRNDLEQAVRSLEATRAVVVAVGAETDLDRVLELIVKRGRALVEARSVVILLREGDELVVAATAGHARPAGQTRIPVHQTMMGDVMSGAGAERVADIGNRLRIASEQIGLPDAKTALAVPLRHRGEPLGVLVAFDHGATAAPFSDEHEQALKAFAAAAANAVATAQSVQQQRLREALAASESERRRWAQELHDETLQALGGLRILLSSARRVDDGAVLSAAADEAIEQIEQEITNLRSIITELRPAALDQLGLAPALEALLERHRVVNDLTIVEDIDLSGWSDADHPADPEVEAAIYRVIQESLTNVVKHAGAGTVRVSVHVDGDRLIATVADDGGGFAVDAPAAGFGLRGMRERMLVLGGDLGVASSDEGTRVTASVTLVQADTDDGTATSPRLSA